MLPCVRPGCAGITNVVDSRLKGGGAYVRRTRICPMCQSRTYTDEMAVGLKALRQERAEKVSLAMKKVWQEHRDTMKLPPVPTKKVEREGLPK